MDDETTELQLKVDGDGQYAAGSTAEHELTFTLDGAEFKAHGVTDLQGIVASKAPMQQLPTN